MYEIVTLSKTGSSVTNEAVYSSKLIKMHKLECGRSGNEAK